MIRRRTITSYVWNSVSGNKMVILSNCIRNFFRKFELLGNSMQGENPAPDNPQEIKSAGRKSKNLFNIADLRVGQVQKDGTINEKSTHSRTAILDVPEDGKYRIAFNSNDDYTMLYFAEMYTNGVYSQPYVRVHAGNSNSLISLKKGKNILSFSTYNNNTQVDFPKDHNIMIAAESETLGYEPYGYLLEMKITGKNLLSNKPTDWMIGKTTSWGAVPQTPVSYGKNVKNTIAIINVKSSTNYSFINKETNKLWVCRIIELDANGLGLVNHALYANESFNYKKYNFSTRSNTANIVFEIKKVDNTELLSTDIESNKIMLVEGEVNEPTPYEPYTEQSVQIALDEPLRGVGEYKDTITKDGAVRKIHEQTLKKERISMNEYNWDRKFFRLYVNSDKKIDSSTTITRLFSNMFKGFAIYKGNPIIYWLISEEEIRSMSVTEADSREVAYEKIKDFVTNNDIVVQYPIAETTLEPLPESVQAQLQALHSENGTTHVFVDSGEVECGINIEYKYKS